MIVVDNTVLVGFVLGRDAYHRAALKAHERDPDWHAPELARSEFRSVAAGALRAGEALPVLLKAATLVDQAARFYRLDATAVFAVLQESPLSAYDAEYVALSRRLGCRLVTSDAQILRHYPDLAVDLKKFVAD